MSPAAHVHERTLSETVHYFAPRGAVKEAFESREGELLLSGPAGTGKSRGLMEKLHIAALKYPGMRALIVRKVAVTLPTTALVTWNKLVTEEAQANGTVSWYGGSAQEPAQYVYSNGSRVVVGGLDKPTKIMSSEYDMIYVQEAIELTVTDWENLTTRLRYGRMPYQQLLADTNPGPPSHWLNQRCLSGATRMLFSRHEDNPRLYDEDRREWTDEGKRYLTEVLDKLTGVRKQRLRYGRWVAAEGVIYDEFDPDHHLLDPFEIPEDWTRVWAVDFGYKNPFVLQCWAVDGDGRLYLYRELYRTERLVEDHARDILDVVAPWWDASTPSAPNAGMIRKWIEPKPVKIICDHDAEDRATLERHLKMGTVPANKTVSEGIQAMQSRIRVQPDGRARLFILKNARMRRDQELADTGRPTSTAEEMPGYIWEPTPDGKVEKDRPLKENDHGLDAARYVVADQDIRKRPRVTVAGAGPVLPDARPASKPRHAHDRFTRGAA